MIRAVIVDDEPMARLLLHDLLAAENDVTVIGEAGDGTEAVRLITSTNPDLVFLDVQMPEMDGFGVVEAVGLDRLPYVIFVTAYDQYAVKAFEIHALDYLLKPFSQARFKESLDHARRQIAASRTETDMKSRIRNLLREIQAETPYLTRFFIQSKGKVCFLKADEVGWIESAGNYALLHTATGEHVVREALGDLEKKLDPHKFVRVNRSCIIQVETIKEIQPYFHGEYILVLKNDRKVTVSRHFRENFQRILGRRL